MELRFPIAALTRALTASLGLLLVIPGAWAAGVPDKAKSACLMAVNNQYGGLVKDVKVESSEFSQANSMVMVKAIGVRGSSRSESWKCLVSNSGKVEDLSVMPSGPRSNPTSSEVSAAAKSACMVAVNGQYGGNVRNLKVMRSEFSQANSLVMVKAIGVRGGSTSEQWKCLVSNSGKVQELSVVSP
jgi:hypothetical protein